MNLIRRTLLLAGAVCACASAQISQENSIRVAEYYRLADRVQDRVWNLWSYAPKGLVLVTSDTEYLTHYAHPPAGFRPAGNGFVARPRTLDPSLQATFPVFDGEPVVVIGESKGNPTAWLFTALHEHFHQLQDSQPRYFAGVEALGLSRGDKSGQWMLNYPFPYERKDVQIAFKELRDALVRAMNAASGATLKAAVAEYAETRRRFLAQVSADDAKYFEFQLWQEGIARYTEILAAEEAAKYQPTAKFAALPGYTPVGAYSVAARQNTLDELAKLDLGKDRRNVVYAVGATEGLLLDRLASGWKTVYFSKPFSMGPYFAELKN